MVAHGVHVRPRLKDLAVDHALRIRPFLRRYDRIGVEIVFEDVVRLDQSRRARARKELSIRIVRVAQADMAEGIEDAFVRHDAVSGGEVAAKIGECVGQGGDSWL